MMKSIASAVLFVICTLALQRLPDGVKIYERCRKARGTGKGVSGDGENGSFSVPMAHNKVIPNGLLRATHSRNPTPTFAYRVAKRHFYAHVGASH